MIDVQRVAASIDVDDASLVRAAQAVLVRADVTGDLTVRIVERDEMQAMNARFRGKDAPTNVLSFAQDVRDENDTPLLGDIVLCADVVEREAQEQGKTVVAHYQHMVVHGTLHLLGYDHIDDDDALRMEQFERDVLSAMNVSDPYAWPTGQASSAFSNRTTLDV
ncbi:MAG: rRNA maturation RNase YbeY [Gammaproteobacteria bacterium]